MLGASDFTTIEVWTKSGLVTFYLLFVMEVATRRVHFAGCTTRLIEGGEEIGRVSGPIQCRRRLGGLLRYYYREAA